MVGGIGIEAAREPATARRAFGVVVENLLQRGARSRIGRRALFCHDLGVGPGPRLVEVGQVFNGAGDRRQGRCWLVLSVARS